MKKRLFFASICLLLIGCASKNLETKQESIEKKPNPTEKVYQEDTKTEPPIEEVHVLQVPSKNVVLAIRENALAGMLPEDIDRIKSVIKSANQSLEYLYIFSNLEYCFSDPET